jgi:hypothetical protein
MLSLIIVFANGCKSPSSPQELQNGLQLDRNTVADKFGDNNGVTTTQELQGVADYFASNDSAWCLQICPSQVSDATSISAQQVKDSFVLQCHPYPSEQALRSAYEGIAIKTPWVSVMMLEQNNGQINAVSFYRSPGATFANANWSRLKITQ